MTAILHEVTNEDYGITACIFECVTGGFGVSLRDDDAGEYVPVSIHNYKTVEVAIEKAHKIACVA